MRRSLLCVHGLIGGVIQQAEQTHHTTAAAFVVDSVWLLRHFIVILHLSVPILFLLLLILHIFVVSFRFFFCFFFWSLIVHLNKIPSTSVDTCIRQISGCPPSSRTDGLINWLEELGFLFSEGGWDVSLGLGVVTQRPLVCLIFSTILHLKGGVAKEIFRKNEVFIKLEFCPSQFILSSLLSVVDAVELHQNLWSCDSESDKNKGKVDKSH